MKKFIILVFFLFIPFSVFASDNDGKIDMYFFYGDGCPHCTKEEIFLDKLEKENTDIVIERYEVWRNKENAELLAKIAKELNIKISGVPVLIIGDEAITGYSSDKTTGQKILDQIDFYRINECTDIVSSVIDPTDEHCVHGCDVNNMECVHDCGCEADTEKSKKDVPELIHIPLIGDIETKNFSLPVLTFLIAAVDGFNPCAMWVLLFLINLLLGMKDRRRMWLLGLAFIFTSGLVYFLFLSAWLNLFIFLGFVFVVRIVIGVVALGSGGYHLYDFYFNKDAVCKVTGGEKRKKIFDKLKEIVIEKKFLVALAGIMVLAFAVNLVELVCSAGLPAIYTQILALSDLPSWQYYGYLVFYIFIFMLDDLFVFVIAMTTLNMKVISSKYSRWSNLVGGIAMIIIGILLIFKPGWLMF